MQSPHVTWKKYLLIKLYISSNFLRTWNVFMILLRLQKVISFRLYINSFRCQLIMSTQKSIFLVVLQAWVLFQYTLLSHTLLLVKLTQVTWSTQSWNMIMLKKFFEAIFWCWIQLNLHLLLSISMFFVSRMKSQRWINFINVW